MRRGAWIVSCVLLLVSRAAAQQTLDRSQPPVLLPITALTLPKAEAGVLRNGLRLYVVRMPEVPVVQLMLSVAGGGREDGTRPGLAAFTGNMLDEGADTLDAFGIAAQAEYLGATLTTEADWDAVRIALKVPKRRLMHGVRLMADVALRPTFMAVEIDRQRKLRLAQILQERDVPESVATIAFYASLYPKGHPYHFELGGDSASVAQFDSTAVRTFYHRIFQPSRASIFVTGDITLTEARAAIEREFGAWQAGGPTGSSAQGRGPARPRTGVTAIQLIDKPGAAQSVIRAGTPGVDRRSPDFYALEVMNTILGGTFSARLNYTLRETKGYTYGAFSSFQFRPLPGPFFAASSVRSDVTDSSLVEIMRELRAIRDAPVDSVELARAQSYITLGLAGQFETSSQMAERMADLLRFGLPLDYYSHYVQRIRAVKREDVLRVARKHLQPDSLAVVVVGDVAKVRSGIDALRLGKSQVQETR